MDKLISRATDQRVINSLDYKRITSKMSDMAIEGLRDSITVIDSINGVKVASLFGTGESVLDRAELNGGINADDFGKLTPDDRRSLEVRNIRIDNTLETVGTPPTPMIERAEFEAMTDTQRDEVIKTKRLVDKLPIPDLTRDVIHEITLRVSQQTQEVLDGGGAIITGESNGKED